jgi:phage-related protein (TIGR01555 family)
MAQAKARRTIKTASKVRRDSSTPVRPKLARRIDRASSKRADGYQNRHSGHGTTRDRRVHTTYVADRVDDIEAIELWSSEDIAARIIETAPREAVRRGFSINAQDKELSQIIEASVEELDVKNKVMKAKQMARALGGAAIFPVMDSSDDLSKPLNEGSIGKITALHLLEPRELQPVSWYGDIQSPKFLRPKSYRLNPITIGTTSTTVSQQIIHESRLVIFRGQNVTRRLRAGQRPGWDDSVLNRPQRVIADYGIAWAGAAHLLTAFAQGVLKLDGFADLSAQQQDEIISRRLAAIDMAMSTIKMMVIDREDEYSRQQTPLSGLSDLLIQFAQRVAAAADMPVTILMGMSPAGLNATGDMDIRSWYDRVAAVQEEMRPAIEHIVRLLLISADGPTQGIEPEQWSIEFHPLWAPSSMEKAQERKLIAETDKIYLDAEVVSPQDVAESRWKGDTYSAEMVIDWKARDKQLKLDAIKVKDLDAAAIAAMRPGLASVKPNDADLEEGATPAPELDLEEGATPKPKPVLVPSTKPKPVEAKEAEPKAVTPAAPPAPVALNGAQVQALVAVVMNAINGQISRASAVAMIKIAINVTEEQALECLGPEDFKPTVAEAPAAMAA